MTRHNHLQIRGEGTAATVELDGVELQDGLAGLALTMGYGDLPRLRLDPLVIASSLEVTGHVTAYVHPAARSVLESLGWTPPAGEQDQADPGT